MADIKTLVEEAKNALGLALDSVESCGHSLAGAMSRRRAAEDREDVIAALDALAEAHQAEVARLTRELQAASALLKFTPPVCNDIYTADDREVSFGKRAKALRVSIDAALAGASGAQEGERT